MDRLDTSNGRLGSLMLCECGLLRSWHGEMVPAYFGAERFGEMVPFEKMSKGCDGFTARPDQSFEVRTGSYWGDGKEK